MSSLRSRKAAVPKPPTTDSDTDAGDDLLDEPSAPKPAVAHSKGEGKLKKVVKRLVFGTLLLVTLCAIVASGHLATLALVRPRAHVPARLTHPILAVLWRGAGPGGADHDVPRAGQRALQRAQVCGRATLPHHTVGLVLHLHALLIRTLFLRE